MQNFNDTTSVKINREKKNLAKSKGLKLQDLLDSALNDELGLCNEEDKVNERIERLKQEIKNLEIEKEKNLADCDKKINILMKNLRDMRDREEENYNDKINILKAKIEYLEQF